MPQDRDNSVPFSATQRPKEVVQEGLRLDDRGFEEFRTVCKPDSNACAMLADRIYADHVSDFSPSLQS